MKKNIFSALLLLSIQSAHCVEYAKYVPLAAAVAGGVYANHWDRKIADSEETVNNPKSLCTTFGKHFGMTGRDTLTVTIAALGLTGLKTGFNVNTDMVAIPGALGFLALAASVPGSDQEKNPVNVSRVFCGTGLGAGVVGIARSGILPPLTQAVATIFPPQN